MFVKWVFNNGYKFEELNFVYLMYVYEEDVVCCLYCLYLEYKYGLVEKRSIWFDILGNFVFKYDFKIKKKDFFFFYLILNNLVFII